MLLAITLSWVGPNSSVSRTPPLLPLSKLPDTCESYTPMRWMPSPQSPGTGPAGLHCGYGELGDWAPPVSLPTTRLSVMDTLLIDTPVREPVVRMPSPLDLVTVNPLTFTQPDLMVMPARQGALPGPIGPS